MVLVPPPETVVIYTTLFCNIITLLVTIQHAYSYLSHKIHIEGKVGEIQRGVLLATSLREQTNSDSSGSKTDNGRHR